MTDRIDDGIPGIDAPRPLDPDFRSRLERVIVDASPILADREPDEDPGQWSIDGPREVPPRLRARLHATVTSRRGGALHRGIAASIALLMVTSSMMVASRSGDRDASPPVLAAPSDQPASTPSPAPGPVTRPPGSLDGFASSGAFLAYVRTEAVKRVGPDGLGGGQFYADSIDAIGRARAPAASAGGVAAGEAASAPVPGPDRYSKTNVQEEGVDEPDLVKTDGRVLATLARGRLWVLDVTGDRPRLRGSLGIADATGMFLDGDRVIVLAHRWSDQARARLVNSAAGRQWTRVVVVDIANPSNPRIESSLEMEGSNVGARLAGGVVRLILRSAALGPGPVPFEGDWSEQAMEDLEEANKDVIRRSQVGDWMPHFVLKQAGRARQTGHVHDWKAVMRPVERTGLGMTTVLTIDPADPRPDEALSVIGAGEILYASPNALYVTSSPDTTGPRPGRRAVQANPITRIHKFDITDPARARYIGSGAVPGYLLNQFSMSEHEGHLRVATTLQSPWMVTETSSSVVTVLREAGPKLVRVGRVGNLGKGERIYAVRFIGDKGYVVTFRQVDPLYVIDLSTPAAPKVLGELKIPGYSAYLHPVGEDLLLGVGRQADAQGRTGGLQFSLFDVSDPAEPRRLHVRTVGRYAYSEVEQDHHGFLYWQPKRLVVVPAAIEDHESGEYFTGALALTAGPVNGFGEPVRITHMGRSGTREIHPSIRRALVVNGTLLTISDAGVLASDLDTLDQGTWLALQG